MLPYPHLLVLLLHLPTYPLLTLPQNIPPSTPRSAVPTTIQATREQPGTSESCPLELPEDFYRGVSAACGPRSGGGLCCPALAAWLYAAYSSRALATRLLPSTPRSYDELPLLPGDPEPCAAVAEAALGARGVKIPGANDTCGAAACTCGVRLRPMQCPGPFLVVEGNGGGSWVPVDDVAKRLVSGCGGPAVAGCVRCLEALRQLRREDSTRKGSINDNNTTEERSKRECQLMGLTWLLSMNRTHFLPTVAYVLRAFAAGDKGGHPTVCSVYDDMPLPVGSDQLLGIVTSAAGGQSSSAFPLAIGVVVLLFFYLVGKHK